MGKEEGRVAGLWPGQHFSVVKVLMLMRLAGSCLHALIALKHPRWEDFSYERLGNYRNRLHWLGNGMTHNEQTMSGDSE